MKESLAKGGGAAAAAAAMPPSFELSFEKPTLGSTCVPVVPWVPSFLLPLLMPVLPL
jgi:hypothetical protein